MLALIILGLIALSGGFIVSAGVFAIVTSTGLMSRMAGKTHTGRYVRLYEDAVIFGGTLFNIFYIFQISLGLNQVLAKIFIGVFSICAGAFIGALAVSLAESMKATAIFTRRVKIAEGLSFIVLSIALGKTVGALVHYFLLW